MQPLLRAKNISFIMLVHQTEKEREEVWKIIDRF